MAAKFIISVFGYSTNAGDRAANSLNLYLPFSPVPVNSLNLCLRFPLVQLWLDAVAAAADNYTGIHLLFWGEGACCTLSGFIPRRLNTEHTHGRGRGRGLRLMLYWTMWGWLLFSSHAMGWVGGGGGLCCHIFIVFHM